MVLCESCLQLSSMGGSIAPIYSTSGCESNDLCIDGKITQETEQRPARDEEMGTAVSYIAPARLPWAVRCAMCKCV